MIQFINASTKAKNTKGINQFTNVTYPEIEICNYYNTFKSLKETANYFKLDSRTVKNILLKNNIEIVGRGYASNPFTINPFIDKSLEDKSYWFGYIAGDGSISSDNRNNVDIITTDLDIVEQYKSFIGDTLTIYLSKRPTKDCYTLRVCNKDFKEYLIKRGITPKKSLTLDLKVKCNWDIVRGLFDSDGNISKNGFKITSASIKLISYLENFFNTEGFKTSIIKKGNAMDIYIRSNQKPLKDTFKSIRSKLYNNSKYYLKRKKDQIDALCSDT